jgi:predicted secreted protein
MQAAMGTKLKIGANSITELTSIGGLELSADTIESTNLDSNGWRTFIQGLKDGGEVSFSGYFNPADTNGQKAVYEVFKSGVLTDFAILFPSAMGAEWDFQAIVTGFTTGAELEDGISFEGTLKVSGQPSLGLTASGGLTALALAGTGGTLSPAFNNANYSYSFSGVTAASVTVTATAASHTLKLYIDGVYVQDLVSGSASNAISLTQNVGKKLTILAYEAGKTIKTYEIVVVKTA